MKKANLVQILIIIISFIVAIILYPKMPDQMASHWWINWEVNWYMSKFWWLFIMPIVSFWIYLLFLIIPKIDPLKENIKKFRPYFDGFISLILFFLFYIYLLTIFWNLWYKFNMSMMIIPAVSILFYFIWILLSKSKRNWFVWIRTPWTLSSERVWDKTHKLWWKIFKVLAVTMIFSLFIWTYAFFVLVIWAIGSSVFLVVYSYLEYRKEMKK
jgi:uncharacterized membrane protein